MLKDVVAALHDSNSLVGKIRRGCYLVALVLEFWARLGGLGEGHAH